MLKEFLDVCSFELLDALPLICDAQHAIDFILDTTLPNLPHYRMNLSEHVEL